MAVMREGIAINTAAEGSYQKNAALRTRARRRSYRTAMKRERFVRTCQYVIIINTPHESEK